MEDKYNYVVYQTTDQDSFELIYLTPTNKPFVSLIPVPCTLLNEYAASAGVLLNSHSYYSKIPSYATPAYATLAYATPAYATI